MKIATFSDKQAIMSTATESRPLFIRLTLPDGLEEALEGLAREVLRHHPDNIYEFAADHFEQQLKKRGFASMYETYFLFILFLNYSKEGGHSKC